MKCTIKVFLKPNSGEPLKRFLPRYYEKSQRLPSFYNVVVKCPPFKAEGDKPYMYAILWRNC